MAGDGFTKITDLKEELASLHTGLWGNATNITTGEFYNKKKKLKPYIRDDISLNIPRCC